MSGLWKWCWVSVTMVLVAMILAMPASAIEVKFGVKAGYQHSRTTYEDDETLVSSLTRVFLENQDWKAGSAFGIYAVAPVSPVAALQIELLYSRRGTKLISRIPLSDDPYAGPLTAFYSEKGMELTYLDIPMLMRVGPAAGDVFGLAGVAVGVPLDQKIVVFEDGMETKVSLDDRDKTDVALVAGAGADLGPVELEIRYHYGIRSLNKWGANDVSSRHWSAMVGVPF